MDLAEEEEEKQETQLLNLDDVSSSEDNVSDDGLNSSAVRKFRKNRHQNPLSRSMDLGDLTDSDKNKRGQITTDENKEEARVEFSIYREYFG